MTVEVGGPRGVRRVRRKWPARGDCVWGVDVSISMIVESDSRAGFLVERSAQAIGFEQADGCADRKAACRLSDVVKHTYQLVLFTVLIISAVHAMSSVKTVYCDHSHPSLHSVTHFMQTYGIAVKRKAIIEIVFQHPSGKKDLVFQIQAIV